MSVVSSVGRKKKGNHHRLKILHFTSLRSGWSRNIDQIGIYKEKCVMKFTPEQFNGHLDVNKTLQKILKNFNWVKCKEDLSKLIQGCQVCATSNVT